MNNCRKQENSEGNEQPTSIAESAQEQQVESEVAEEQAGFRKKIITRAVVAEYAERTLVLVVGLFIMSFGVAFSINASLGTSPISSVPYVLNLITGLSVGTTTIIANSAIVLIQIILLRRRFEWIQLLQIPVAVVFGLLTDVALMCVDSVIPTQYWAQWLICLAGIVLVAVGVSCEVAANVVTLPGEGLVLTMCKLLPKVKFGYMKVAVDCMLVIIAVALSFIFLGGLYAVREGTVAAALLVGIISRQIGRITLPAEAKIVASIRRSQHVA